MRILQESKKIIKEYNLQKYLDVLLDYIHDNPVDPGHDFSHFIKVSFYAFELSQDHDYPSPEELFAAMLFHDIYRPSEGKDGMEDQSEGADIVKKLFGRHNLDLDTANLCARFIKEHDKWPKGKIPERSILYMSIADKIGMSISRSDSYTWASNKYHMERFGSKLYKNHLDTTYAFTKFQVGKWKSMMDTYHRWGIPEARYAMESYMKIYRNVINQYFDDPMGERFDEYLDRQVAKRRIIEENNLKFFLGKDTDVSKYLIKFDK